jgi:hypothetical protein
MKYGISVLGLGIAAALAVPPARAAADAHSLAGYAHYELHDITAEVKVHPKVMAKLETELKQKLEQPVATWNAAGANPGHAGTLAIEVAIVDMKFVSGGKRFFAGGFAGDSHAAGTVTLIDKDTGKVVLTQHFINRANGIAGAWSFGATDNGMLDHLAANMGSWVIAMHDGSTPPPTDTTEPDDKKAASN